MATRRPFWKRRRWKSIGFCLWPPSTCIWNLKLKFHRKLDLCAGNHVVYRQTDGRTDGRTRWIQYTPPPPPPHTHFVGRGYNNFPMTFHLVLVISNHLVTRGRLIIKCRLTSIGIPMLKIRRSRNRLIFNMGIPIPGKNGLYIETGPR